MNAGLDQPEFDRWRDEADRALAGAELQRAGGLHNWACFAAEQAAQLAVKALLHGAGVAPWGHDLVRLGEAAKQSGINLPVAIEDALRRLSRHYIPARYPDAHPAGSPGTHYGEADAAEALADARAILDFVDATWKGLRGTNP